MSELNLIPLNNPDFTFLSAFTYNNNTTNNIIINGSLSGDTLSLYRFDGTSINITGFTNNGSGGITGLTYNDVVNALGYVPYNSNNPNQYINFTSGDTKYYLNTNPSYYIQSSFTENNYYKLTNPSNYISSITYNNVISALGYTPLSSVTNNIISYSGLTVTGDVTGSTTNNNLILTLNNITTGQTVGSSTQIPIITYDNKGRITSASTISISIPTQGITTINNQTGTTQTLITGNTGNDFNIVSNGGIHTFNIPTASSGITRGLLTSSDWVNFNNKQTPITLTTTGITGAASYLNSIINIPKGYDELSTLGVIKSFTGSQFNVTTDWNTASSGGSFTFGSNKLALSGTVGSTTFTNYVNISTYTSNLDNFELEKDFTVTSVISATTYGFSLGIKSFGSQTQNDFVVKVGMTTSDFGKLYIYTTGGVLVATSNNRLAGANGDSFTLKISVHKSQITAILTCTSGTVINQSISIKASTNSGNTYRAVIYQHGGSIDVTRLVYSSQQVVGAEYLAIGDSITRGSIPTNINLKWFDLISETAKGRFVIQAGSGNVSSDALTTIQETINLAPKTIFIFIGTNDAGFGISSATYAANMASIVSTLNAAGYVVGINIFFISILPRNDVSVTAYNTAIKTAYTTAFIDANLTFQSSTNSQNLNPLYDAVDQLHLNTLGHQDLATFVQVFKPSLFIKKDVAKPSYLPLTYTRTLNTILNLPSQTLSPETNIQSFGMVSTQTFKPVVNLTSNLHFGHFLQATTSGALTSYANIGVANKLTHNGTGAITVGIANNAEIQTNSIATISTAICNYNLLTSNISGASVTNLYSTYSALPKVYSGTLTGTNLYLNYIEDASAPTSTYIPGNFSVGAGTFTNKWGLYAAGGNHSFAGNSNVGIGITTPTSRLHVIAGTLNNGIAGMYYSATMPTTITASNYAINNQITSAGSSFFINGGVNVDYIAGYTGGNRTLAGRFANAAAGTGTTITSLLANAGIQSSAFATTTGTNIGMYASGSNGNINIGVAGLSTTNKNSATNVGVIGLGFNGETSPIQVGGYFGLNSTDPVFTNAALIANNDTRAFPIFIAQDNGTSVFTINDGGNVGVGTTVTTSTLNLNGSLGLTYVVKTGTYTATSSDYLINCTANTFTVTLPTAVGIDGRIYEIVNSGVGTITIATTSSQTFTNVTATPTTLSLLTAAGKSIRVMSNGANWIQLN